MAGRRLNARLVLAGAVALLAGCGTGSLDTSQVETRIADQIAKQTGAAVRSVACPDDIEAKKGATFPCLATGTDGSAATIDVLQTSAEGNLSIDAPLLHTTEAERAIAKDIGGGAKIDCPELVLVAAGKTFECKLTHPGSGTVRVTLKDGKGNFEYEVNR